MFHSGSHGDKVFIRVASPCAHAIGEYSTFTFLSDFCAGGYIQFEVQLQGCVNHPFCYRPWLNPSSSGERLNVTVTATAPPQLVTRNTTITKEVTRTLTVEVQATCPPGFWCSAGSQPPPPPESPGAEG